MSKLGALAALAAIAAIPLHDINYAARAACKQQYSKSKRRRSRFEVRGW